MAIIGAKETGFVLNFLNGYSFTQDVSKVVLGSCPNGLANVHCPEIGCSTFDRSSELNPAFWQHHLEGVEGNVLILTECCGQYKYEQVETLSKMFPKITFITPHINDYGDRFEWSRVEEDLLEAGIIVKD